MTRSSGADHAAVLAGRDARIERLMVLDVSTSLTGHDPTSPSTPCWLGAVSLVHVEGTGPWSVATVLTHLGERGWAGPMPRTAPPPPHSLMIAETAGGDSVADFLLDERGRAWLGEAIGLVPGPGALFQLRGATPPMVQGVPLDVGPRPAPTVATGGRGGRRLGPADGFDYGAEH